jgi:prepilin-type processing-associated H-X9-DG protein
MANIGGPPNFLAWSGIFVGMKDNDMGFAGNPAPNSNCGTLSIASVTDGTSNTALFSESLLGSGPAAPIRLDATKRRGTYLFPTGLANPLDQGAAGAASAVAFFNACKSLPGTTLAFGTLSPPNGNIWLAGNTGSCLMWNSYNHFSPPNGNGCIASNDGNTGGYGNIMDAMPPSSNHPGGVNVGMADGSVRFIKDTVNMQAWWAIGSRNGGEVVSADSY